MANDTDPQWQSTYRDIYNASSLNIPWYALLGNHDHHLNRSRGQIDYYLNHRDNRWICPALYYDFHFKLGKSLIQFIYIDTVILSGGDDAGINVTAAELQWQWLNETLESSTAQWIIVAGHYPVYSAGEHGNTDNLVARLRPLMEYHGVDLYLCGHDHTLQHLRESATGVQYLVSGNAAWRGTIAPIPETVWGVVDPGLFTHRLTETHLTSRAVDLTGKVVYELTQQRRVKRWERDLGEQALSYVMSVIGLVMPY